MILNIPVDAISFSFQFSVALRTTWHLLKAIHWRANQHSCSKSIYMHSKITLLGLLLMYKAAGILISLNQSTKLVHTDAYIIKFQWLHRSTIKLIKLKIYFYYLTPHAKLNKVISILHSKNFSVNSRSIVTKTL